MKTKKRFLAVVLAAALLVAGLTGCKDALREFSLYRWDSSAETDRVIKENDHAMDDIRYFCYTVIRRADGAYSGESI